MNRKSWAQLGLVIVLLAVAGTMFFRGSSRPRIDFDPYKALGSVTAEEVAKALGGQGRVVLVLPASGPDPDPVMDAQVAAFKSALKTQSQGKIEVSATVPVAMDPFQRMSTGGAMPADQFQALRRQHADAAGYVFFIGFPALTEAERSGLQGGKTKMMVVSAPLPGYDLLLRDGILEFAIVSRTVAADAAPVEAKTTREIFDREYLLLRSERASAP